MQVLNLINTLFLLVVSATVTAAFTGEPFEVTNLKVDVDRTEGGDFSVSFTIHDPDPLTDATQTCSKSWEYGSKGYPSGSYALCGNSTFGWNMARFNGYQRFDLGLQHLFKDPSLGDPPYDSVITFGTANVNRTNLACENSGEIVSCSQKGGIILGPITRTSAK